MGQPPRLRMCFIGYDAVAPADLGHAIRGLNTPLGEPSSNTRDTQTRILGPSGLIPIHLVSVRLPARASVASVTQSDGQRGRSSAWRAATPQVGSDCRKRRVSRRQDHRRGPSAAQSKTPRSSWRP